MVAMAPTQQACLDASQQLNCIEIIDLEKTHTSARNLATQALRNRPTSIRGPEGPVEGQIYDYRQVL
jgi:hypothetical protein